MNRQQRRGAHRANKKVKPPYRQSSLALLTVAGLAGSSLGLAAPVNALTPCDTINSQLLALESTPGTLNLNWVGTDSCLLDRPYILSGSSTINGPTSGDRLTLQVAYPVPVQSSSPVTYADSYALSSNSELNISHVDFTGGSPAVDELPAAPITSILSLGTSSDTTLTDVSFSNSYLSGSAIEAAPTSVGHLVVNDSSFTNLITTGESAALQSDGITTINNSTFSSNAGVSIGNAGDLSVHGSTFSSNAGVSIGNAGDLSVYGSAFSSNLDTAISVGDSGILEVSDSSFDLNIGGYGGAISNGTGLVTVNDSSFDFNSATYMGGAIYSEGGLVEVENSTFNSNTVSNSTGSSTYGGAIYGDEVEIDNSTFYGNTSDYGAAASIGEGSLISNSTFWNNKATVVDAGSIEGSNISFFGNILANDDDTKNTLANLVGITEDLGANLYTGTSLFLEGTDDGQSMLVDFADLKLISLSLNQTSPVNTGITKTVALGAGSIARDYYAASSSGINPTGYAPPATLLAVADQRGVFRPDSARYDVGAYEAGEEAAPVATTAVATKATIAMQKITFGPDSSRLTIASKKKLSALATEIQAKGLNTISLEGYTATLTKAAPSGKKFRVSLSKDRASAVEKYLKIKFKKNSYEVTFTKSPKGAANPVKSNKTEKGRKANRRVEIAIN